MAGMITFVVMVKRGKIAVLRSFLCCLIFDCAVIDVIIRQRVAFYEESYMNFGLSKKAEAHSLETPLVSLHIF